MGSALPGGSADPNSSPWREGHREVGLVQLRYGERGAAASAQGQDPPLLPGRARHAWRRRCGSQRAAAWQRLANNHVNAIEPRSDEAFAGGGWGWPHCCRGDARASKAGKAKASISPACHLGPGTSRLDGKEENICGYGRIERGLTRSGLAAGRRHCGVQPGQLWLHGCSWARLPAAPFLPIKC